MTDEEFFEEGTDLQLGKYDIEVMNGLGYYDETGTYQAYACSDQADL